MKDKYMRAEKTLDHLIDSFIRSMEMLRVRHKKHLNQYMNRNRNGLLLNKEALNRNKPTGNDFWEFIHQPTNLSLTDSPFLLIQ